MKVSYRNYKCRNCGHVQPIQTNHKLACYDYCKECSWKPSFGRADCAVPMFGHTYRPFDYAGKYSPKVYA